ncbi:uncharacterized protein LOC135394125 [Ornithodoros turicata]|uniref:uncharacterized protein LOC135394125 n=1 Tax=Ornithodoros turicata TaxID=34597 RepID=UPI003139EA44
MARLWWHLFLRTSCALWIFDAFNGRPASASDTGYFGDEGDPNLWLRRNFHSVHPSDVVGDGHVHGSRKGTERFAADLEAHYEGSGDPPTFYSHSDYNFLHLSTAVHHVASPRASSSNTEALARSSISYPGPSAQLSAFDFDNGFLGGSSSEAFIASSFPETSSASSIAVVFSSTPSASLFQTRQSTIGTEDPVSTKDLERHPIPLLPSPTFSRPQNSVTKIAEWSRDHSVLLDSSTVSSSSSEESAQIVPTDSLTPQSTDLSSLKIQPTSAAYVDATSVFVDTTELNSKSTWTVPDVTTDVISRYGNTDYSNHTLTTPDLVRDSTSGNVTTTSNFPSPEYVVPDDSSTRGHDENADTALSSTRPASLSLTESAASPSSSSSSTATESTVSTTDRSIGTDVVNISSPPGNMDETSTSSSPEGVEQTATPSVNTVPASDVTDDVTAITVESQPPNDEQTTPTSLITDQSIATVPDVLKPGVTNSEPQTTATNKVSSTAPPSTIFISTKDGRDSEIQDNLPSFQSSTTSSSTDKDLEPTDAHLHTPPSFSTTTTDTKTHDAEPEEPTSSTSFLDSLSSSPEPNYSVRTIETTRLNSVAPPFQNTLAPTFSTKTAHDTTYPGTSTTIWTSFSGNLPSITATHHAWSSETNFWDRFRLTTKSPASTTLLLLTTASRWLATASPTWSSPKAAFPDTRTTPVAPVRPVSTWLPQPVPAPDGALSEKNKYWIRTVFRMNDVGRADPDRLADQLAFIYERAFAQKHAFRQSKRALGRSTSIHVVHLAMDYKDKLMSLVYALSRDGQLVPAVDAVQTMTAVQNSDMSSLLGYEVVTKAEPYVEVAEPSKALFPLTWIVIGVLAGILVFVIVCLLLYCKCCRPKYTGTFKDVESVHSFGKENRKKAFEGSAGNLSMFGERTYKDVFTSPIHFPSSTREGNGKRTTAKERTPKLSEYYVNQAYEPDRDTKMASVIEVTPQERSRGKRTRPRVVDDPSRTYDTVDAEFDHIRRDTGDAPLPLPRTVIPAKNHSVSDSDTSLTSTSSTASTSRVENSPPDSASASLLPDEVSSEAQQSDQELKATQRQLDKMKRRMGEILDDTRSYPRNMYDSLKKKRVSPSGTVVRRQASSLRSPKARYHNAGGLMRTRSADFLDSCSEYPAAPEVEVVETRDVVTQTGPDLPMTKPRIIWSIYKTPPSTLEATSHEGPPRASTLPEPITTPFGFREPTKSVISAIRGELRKFNGTHTKTNGESFA